MSSSSSLAAKAAESELRKRIENLEMELRSARGQLARVTDGDVNTESLHGNGASSPRPSSSNRREQLHNLPTRPPPQKRGYLFR